MKLNSCNFVLFVTFTLLVTDGYHSHCQPGVLFVFDHWGTDQLGLPGFHRGLVKEFIRRKDEHLRVYSTVIDTEVSDQILEDAKSIDVNLILPKRKKRINPLEDTPKIQWLVNHESYYPSLDELKHITYVVGYAPKTADAAGEIRDALFPDAHLVLINHVVPDINSHLSSSEISEQMLKWAKEADILFSIGPYMYYHFENVYRVDDLYEKPHKEYLPRPDEFFFHQKTILKNNPKWHVLLTYGKINGKDELGKTRDIADALGEITNLYKTVHTDPPQWVVAGLHPDIDRTVLTDKLKKYGVKFSLYDGPSTASLAQHLQQSHLCLITKCYEEYSFDGLEAMAIGIPLLAPEDSQIAVYIREYFTKYKLHDVVRDPEKEWPGRITGVLADIMTAFQIASDLKDDFECNTNISDSHSVFAAMITSQTPPSPTDCNFKDDAVIDLEVQIHLNRSIYERELPSPEQTAHIHGGEEDPVTVQEDEQLKERKQLLDILEDINETYKKTVQKLIRDDESRRKLKNICYNNFARLRDIEEGSLQLKLNFSCLLNLYKFEGKCRSGRFAVEFEQLLITDEMREQFEMLNITRPLRVVYDDNNFQRVERFFMERDGGLLKNIDRLPEAEEETFEDEIESDIDDKYLIESFNGNRQEGEVTSEEPVDLDLTVNVSLESMHFMTSEEEWIWFILMIEPWYAMILVFLIVIITTLVTSSKSATEHGKRKLLVLEIDTSRTFRKLYKRQLLRLFNAKNCVLYYKSGHTKVIGLVIKVTRRTILGSRQDILSLLGIRRYLVVPKDVRFTIPELKECIANDGTQVTHGPPPSKALSLTSKSLFPLFFRP
ncbi:uncharacterized protein LOC144439650 isoform X2 [Glandiceps talaboti]